MSVTPRPLIQDDVAAAIETLVLAFDADPMFRYLMSDDRTRADWLRFVFAASFALSLPEEHVLGVDDDGVAGVLQLFPPERYPPPATRLPAWLATPWRWPIRRAPPWRMLRDGLRVTGAMDREHLREPHWYIQVFAVHPARQGRGLGRALMDAGLALADRDGLPAYLETTNDVNLPLYRHFGFEVVQEIVLPGGFPPLWTMLRPARG